MLVREEVANAARRHVREMYPQAIEFRVLNDNATGKRAGEKELSVNPLDWDVDHVITWLKLADGPARQAL